MCGGPDDTGSGAVCVLVQVTLTQVLAAASPAQISSAMHALIPHGSAEPAQ